MSGILSSQDIAQLGLLRALVDPTAKEAIESLINQIMVTQKNAELAVSNLRTEEARNQGILQQVDRERSAAAEDRAHAEAQMHAVTDREKVLGEVQDAFNAEKKTFEEVRANVEAQQKEQALALASREAANRDLAQRLAEIQREQMGKDDALGAREARLKRVESLLFQVSEEMKK